MPIKITLPTDDGDGEEVTIPSIKEVCGYCQGEGKSSAYMGSFTQEEWDREDFEWQEDYMSGHYDRECPECKGLRVVDVPDMDKVEPELRTRIEEFWQDQADYAAEREAERRMGA